MEHVFVLSLVALALLLFALEVTRPDIVALGVLLVLLLTGLVSIEEGFSGFSNPAVITVIAMFILSSGLVRSGVADAAAAAIVRFGGGNPVLLTVAVMLVVGTMSAFMNNIGATAVLLPAVFAVARRSRYPVTKLLIPLSFGSLLGGLNTLIGTPPNLLVSIALEEHGFEEFQMFDFLPTGLAVLGTSVLYMVLVGRHLLPSRKGAGGLTQEYKLQDYLTEAVVPEGSPLVGKPLVESGLRQKWGVTVVRIRRSGVEGEEEIAPGAQTVLKAGDRLVVEGDLSELLLNRENAPLHIHAVRKCTDRLLTGDDAVLGEAAVAPNARILGRSIKQLDILRRFGVLVLAMRRRGLVLQAGFDDVSLEVGDVLLTQGIPETLRKLAENPDFLVVNILDHPVRRIGKAPFSLAIMLLMIGAAATGLLHISVAGFFGVLLMVLTGCVRVQDIYGQVEWRVIFLIACMMPLGTVMDDQHTGTARWLADGIVSWVGDLGPLVMLGCLILFTTLITEVMSNAAAAVLLAPIGIAIAVGMGLQPHPFLMGIAIGASTTFLTPIGHQANVLVYGVGNYRFGEFPKVGALLNLLIFAVAMLVIPAIWPFQPL